MAQVNAERERVETPENKNKRVIELQVRVQI
jgi:hypothetical protein